VTAEVGSATEGLVVAGSAREAAATATAERCSLARHSSARPAGVLQPLCTVGFARAVWLTPPVRFILQFFSLQI